MLSVWPGFCLNLVLIFWTDKPFEVRGVKISTDHFKLMDLNLDLIIEKCDVVLKL